MNDEIKKELDAIHERIDTLFSIVRNQMSLNKDIAFFGVATGDKVKELESRLNELERKK